MKLNKIVVLFTTLLAISFLIGCSDEDPSGSSSSLNRVSFEGSVVRFGLEAGQTASKTLAIYTNDVTNQDRVFDVIVDNSSLRAADRANPDYYTVPATVTVPANSNKGEFVVNATNFNLGKGKAFILKFKGKDGVDGGNALRVNLREVCPSNVTTVALDITLDQWGSETTWELYDSSMNLVESGGPYADSAAGTIESAEFCLSPGDYTFVILDVYSDGICCGAGDGAYTLKKIGSERNTLIVAGGAFGAFEATPFTIQ